MPGLTPLGIVHTAMGLVALAAGIGALVRYKRIAPDTRVGVVYIVATIVVCVSGFGIFRHGRFTQGHLLGIVTLLTLGLAAISREYRLFGGASPYVELASYSTTFFFHMIPTVAETATRLPVGAPLAASQNAPGVQLVIAALFIVLIIGVTLQLRWLRGTPLGFARVARKSRVQRVRRAGGLG